MYENFKTYLSRYITISESEWQLIEPRLYIDKAVKGEILLHANQVCKNVYFIVEGSMRTFFLSKNGNESTRLILFEHETMAALASFINQEPSEESIEALENCTMLRMSRQDFYELLSLVPKWETYFRMRLEAAQVLNTWRMQTLLSMDAKHRYVKLLETYPIMIQRLPNHIIASYLGITQESLSRIKSKR
jgi:CRP-like cAMP-binding protein